MQRFRGWFGQLIAMSIMVLWVSAAAAEEVRLVYVGVAAGSVWRGVLQGLQEAEILGGFTGYTFRVQPMTTEVLRQTGTIPSPAAVLAATDAKTLLQLAADLSATSVAVLNLTATDDELRQACLPNLLHIPPSTHMQADAVAQWQKKHPAAKVQAHAWHKDFKKFAARELNSRFRKAYGVPMDDEAWAGWAALKMLSETVARTRTTEPARILAYLRHELEFDGQKGVPHTFRDTGQLRQPLLIVGDGKLLGEAPVREVADGLDSLGLPACP